MKVRLRPGDRAILERRGCALAVPSRGSCCGYGSLLEATDGHATREIARELETTPTTVSLWRIRYAREGLDGLEDRLRSGTPPIYGEATDQRIRTVLDQPPPKGFARWNGPLIARALGDVDVQYVWLSLRKQKIDLPAKAGARATIRILRQRPPMWSVSIWRRPKTRLFSVLMRSRRSRPWNGRKLFEIAERTRPDGAQP